MSLQGLADEEYELDDEEEEELGEGEEGPGEGDENDEEPILTRGHKHTNGTASKAALPSYGYRDLFGKEMEGRRRQMIEVKVSGGRAVTGASQGNCVVRAVYGHHWLGLAGRC